MRFDREVIFQQLIPGVYDPKTGNTSEPQTRSVVRYASVTNAGTEQIELSNAAVTAAQGSLTLRVCGWVTDPFDQIVIDGKAYRPIFHRRLRRMETYIVSEVTSV